MKRWTLLSFFICFPERNIQRQDFTMKTLIFLCLLVIYLHGTLERLHSLRFSLTGSSEVPHFPEFVVVALVDDIQIFHYDSNTRRAVATQDWMEKVTVDNPPHWEKETESLTAQQQGFKINIGNLKLHFKQTGGVHVFQLIYGCEWDDETDKAVSGFYRFGYDGEDFMSFDLETETWIAAKPQAFLTIQKLNKDKAVIAQKINYMTEVCPYWLKKYVDYGKSFLMRTDLPSVSLLQKTSSSPVRCFATGFYPKTASLFWRRDGVEIHEDVEHGEILPNQDGTFQMSVDLNVSSVRAEDWGRLDCVFQFSGVKEDMVTRLDRAVIKTNKGETVVETTENPSYIEIIVGVAVVLAIAIAVIGFLIYRRNCGTNCKIYTETQPHGPTQQSESETAGTHLLDKSESSSPPSSTPTGNSSPSPSQHESV